MVAKKRGLGRGLDALLPRNQAASGDGNGAGGSDRTRDGALAEIPVEFIQPGRYQPRTSFARESLEDLAESIRAQGMMQPIVLRPVSTDRYEIIAGERRWRAAQLAGMDKVPVIIREVSDDAALAMSLIENIQREDLNPLEEARALQRLIDEFQFTHQEVARAVGRSRSGVSNSLRLTHLAPAVAELLEQGKLEMGHARAILALDRDSQAEVAREVASRGLNVRQTEALVRSAGKPGAKKRQPPAQDADTRRLEQRLGDILGQPVQLQHAGKGRGKLIISYNTLDELDGILTRMGYEE